MDELRVRSTSRTSARVWDVVLRETAFTRLVFRPMLVDNASVPSAGVKGKFIFQRKGPKAAWSDVPVAPLSSLKKEEEYSLTLHSAEVLRLFTELRALYEIYKREGIPIGETEFVRAEGPLISLVELGDEPLRVILGANQTIGTNLTTRLLAWATSASNVADLVRVLENWGADALANLSAAVSVSVLKEALQFWRENRGEPREEVWQKAFENRSFLIELLFPWPCTVIKGKAYVGGKTVQNTGGNIVDFLVRNALTSSAALVEIKTPVTKLTGPEYRSVRNVSAELSGSVIQVLSYKAMLQEDYRSLRASEEDQEWSVFDPPCVVIIGSTKELNSEPRRRTLELFRRQIQGVEIITFDELFLRVERLSQVLEERSGASEDPDALPF